jgi:hypothetical protein
MSESLLSEYLKLSKEYDKVLNLSEKLIFSLKEKNEKEIESLLEKKSKTAKAIQVLSEQISRRVLYSRDRENFQLLRVELDKIEKKAYKLLELEKKARQISKEKYKK